LITDNYAVYADGSTAGIAEKITQFKERRRLKLQTVREMIAHLANHSAEETLAWLRTWEKGLE
jgi:hypothetical protein